uniref:Uncharacterized protein n=1 Tax=Sulfolobus neozealandicus TaxID=299422 RepID=Q5NE00_9CREN|nr:hypothetical protein [Sulfolobus neozealandicus]
MLQQFRVFKFKQAFSENSLVPQEWGETCFPPVFSLVPKNRVENPNFLSRLNRGRLKALLWTCIYAYQKEDEFTLVCCKLH